MSSRIQNTVVAVVLVALVLGSVAASSSSSSSPWHKKKRRKGELRRTNRRVGNANEHEYFYYQQRQRALKQQQQQQGMMMMSMGHHDTALMDYFTDDTPAGTTSANGIANASFNSGNEGQQQQQLGNNNSTGSNDSVEITIGFIGDDDENVGALPSAIVDHGMDDVNAMEGIHDSATTSESSSSVNNIDSSNFDLNNGSGSNGGTMSIDSSSVSSNSSSSASNADNDSLNSPSSGINDSTSAETSSSSVAQFDGSDISEFIASTTGDATSSTTSSSANNTNNSGSSNPSDKDNNTASSTSNNSTTSTTIPLTLTQRKSIIESKCQLSIHSRSQAILTLIGSLVSNPELTLVSQVGPQYDAFVWLVHFDDAILCPPSSEDDDNMMVVQRILQRYTLATLYFSMNGNEWTNCPSSRTFFDDNSTANTSTIGKCDNNAVRFLDASHECNWYGITCVGDVEDDVVEYDVDSHYAIDTIILPNNNLSGAIPTEFYNAFEKLRVWNMEKNGGVLGTLSNGVGRLTELELLLLNDNELEGVVPFDAFLKLERLETINLGVNAMSGNATRLCNAFSSTSRELDTFITDCATSVTCPCCTSCA